MIKYLVALLLIPSVAFAATLDVCKSGCTYSVIQTAYNAANDGDIVEVEDSGTYTEALAMNDSATEGSPIIVRAKTGTTPTITYPTEGSFVDNITITGDWNEFRGFIVGPTGRGNGVLVRADNVTVYGNTLINICTEYMAAGTAGEGIEIEGSSNTIEGNTIYNAAHGAITLNDQNGSYTVQYNQILNNTIDNEYGHGISMVYSGVSYNLVDGNKIKDCGSLSDASHQKSAIQLTGVSNNSIRRNVVYDINRRGIELSTYGSANRGTVSDNWIYNNTFFNITTDESGDSPTGNDTWVEISGGYATSTIEDNKFYNNIAAKVGQGTMNEWDGSEHNAWVLGFTEDNDAGDDLTALVTTNDWNGNILKNNCIRIYYSGAYDLTYSDAIQYVNNGSTYRPEWTVTGVNGQGSMSGNVTTDPSFTSENTATSYWWYLQSDSQLIDAGVAVTDPNATTGGWSQLSYEGSALDIGAHEYGVTSNVIIGGGSRTLTLGGGGQTLTLND